jgi:precorrin-6B methylase 2
VVKQHQPGTGGPERIGRRARDRVLGIPLETAMSARDRVAAEMGADFGLDMIFQQLIDAMLRELPEGGAVLEVGSATGAITRELVGHVGFVTAIDISEGMLRTLLSMPFARADNLRVMQGLAEDLPREVAFDAAVVTFTPRRGHALSNLLPELAQRVADRVVVVFPDDKTLDWAYLARTASSQGFGVRLEMVRGDEDKRGVILVADVRDYMPTPTDEEDWNVDAREIDVPYPAPRGTAARLVRYFLSVGDRALLIKTDKRGLQRIYGNLRTAAHRLGQGEVTVRLQEDAIQIVRLPKTTEE